MLPAYSLCFFNPNAPVTALETLTMMNTTTNTADNNNTVFFLVEFGSNGSYWVEWVENPNAGNLCLGEMDCADVWEGKQWVSYSGETYQQIVDFYASL